MRTDPDVAAEWEPWLTSTAYDFGLRPPAEKAGCLAGMGMTEKQGGSDVRANTKRARPLPADGEYALVGAGRSRGRVGAATTVMLRLAAGVDAGESAFNRLALAVAKYWVCKRGPAVVGEALECLGGNGYVEGSGMPLLYREAPLNSIWEGSRNVNALDVLRTLSTQPESLDAFRTEVGEAHGADTRLDAAVQDLLTELSDRTDIEGRVRRVVERMALVPQGSLLVRYSHPDVADAFVRSRLSGDGGLAFGTLPRGRGRRRSSTAHAPRSADRAPERSDRDLPAVPATPPRRLFRWYVM